MSAKVQTVTFLQIVLFQRLAKRAWQKCAMPMGFAVGSEKDAAEWRRNERLAATGKSDIHQVEKVGEFEALMLHFAQIVGDDQEIAYWSAPVERRYRHLIREKLVALTRATGTLHDWKYARGIMNAMHLAENFDDVPATQLLPVFQALDTHLRRVLRRAGEHPHAPEHPHGHAEAA
jgi:hypothetical protein